MMTDLVNFTEKKTPEEMVKERVQTYGTDQVTVSDLLCMMTGDAVIANHLANMSYHELFNMSYKDFMDVGVKRAKAQQLEFGIALGIKLFKKKNENNFIIRTPKDAADYLAPLLSKKSQEHFVAIALDTKNKVIGYKTIFVGAIDMSVCSPREIYQYALKMNARSIIVAHNHPSNDPTPSQEDFDMTKRIADAGKMMNINLLDHVIIGDLHAYRSIKEAKSFLF